MNKINHTPGPWHVNTLEVVPLSIHAARGHVATVSTGSMGECELEECEANARLIAAAPDLLAALEAVQDDLDLLSNLPGGSSELQFMVEYAIAKAKGES